MPPSVSLSVATTLLHVEYKELREKKMGQALACRCTRLVYTDVTEFCHVA